MNQLDQVILQDKTLKELGAADLEEVTESPFIQMHQCTMEIRRQELRWLQNVLKEEKKKELELKEQLTNRQNVLANVLEKLNFQYEAFLNATKNFRETEPSTMVTF